MVGNSDSSWAFSPCDKPKGISEAASTRGLSNLLRNQMQQIKYLPQLGIWGLCLPAEKRGWVAQFEKKIKQFERVFHKSGRTGLNESELHVRYYCTKTPIEVGDCICDSENYHFIASLLFLLGIYRMQ